MKPGHGKCDIVYRPIPFIIGTFFITWCCTGLMTVINYATHITVYTFLDFMENASPLFCALLLLMQYRIRDKFLWRFFLGESNKIYPYIIVLGLFAAQFLNFYLFQAEDSSFSAKTFISAFAGQFFLGGGLEEAGWRGYLFPCFYKNHNILTASTEVSIIWVLWHLPYFFITGSTQAGASFFTYFVIGIITGFILAAIYLLTKSVLFCMFFHSWQNTIVMTIQADMEDVRFMLIFSFLGVVSVLICLNKQRKSLQDN